MVQRASKRLRLNNGSSSMSTTTPQSKTIPNDPLTAASDEDKMNWKGFCEIESEPAFFNVMLKHFGVKGVKVQEVVSLDDELLAYLPRPVYGLIFLSKWREDDPVKQEASCPTSIWFANQTIDNACASVALLNIVNNIPNIHLGEHLKQFKDFTSTFTPALRGDAIGNFEFIRQIHNSFTRKIDMLNGDLFLKNQATAKRRKSNIVRPDGHETDAGFHFIAFVPVDGKIWKLDGLERQPQSIGSVDGDDWLCQVKPDIETRMAEFEDGQIEFAILSLVRDPLLTLAASLASNIKGIRSLSTRLDEVKPDWRDDTASGNSEECLTIDGALTGPDIIYCLTKEVFDTSQLPDSIQLDLLSNVTDILASRQRLVTAQAGLMASIRIESESNRLDEEKAASRRHDYGPLIQKWIQYHARQSAIERVLKSCKAE